ncbi:ARM repeat-containing protein [Pseudovirgaria hyperparasitica]|uniref:eIF-2-alpha kinase activator GCN1 n=1 Tax=Pseudovirgaria hyperparasitica TaxID=470096 RepID=A0A6A6WDM0_9PEZI|nr:ARM repeat-containing protein [Pseudovirgaria hyperparasitica]KAF2759956.1 ARM repeat-containing protein [Pseudovirgaria hyperparasitica]
MAEVKESDTSAEDIRKALLSGSTKRRLAALDTISQQLVAEDLSPATLQHLVPLLFDTYPRYADRPSRRAVQNSLRKAISGEYADGALNIFVRLLETEAPKTSVAPSNAFVLLEWCTTVLVAISKSQERWDKYGLRIVGADAIILEVCMSTDAKATMKQSALVITRRAFRTIFKAAHDPPQVLKVLVSTLSAKGANSKAKNAVALGVIAGVCARLTSIAPSIQDVKKDYYAFYAREILGSKTALPQHITNGMHDFFHTFAGIGDLQKELIPAIEKALLRAPEVVLNDMLATLVNSLPLEMDLSDILLNSLLKPLLSNIKSTSAIIRIGASNTFQALATRSHTQQTIEKVAEELLAPLKQGKVPGAEQKVIHAQMLAALKGHDAPLPQIATALAQVALKESSEQAANAEVNAIAKHVTEILVAGANVESTVSQAFAKGITDKKLPIRRVWALRFGEIIWKVPSHEANTLDFCRAPLSAFIDSWNDIQTNAVPAAQNGLVVLGYILTSLCMSRLAEVSDDKIDALKSKVSAIKTLLVAEPKPSFLLNNRVYTKLTGSCDLVWLIRALASVASPVAEASTDSGLGDAWSQAFIYCLTASSLPSEVRQEAVRGLSLVYSQQPMPIANIIIDGLWNWYRRAELNEKDTAALAAKTGNDQLQHAVSSICMRPEEAKTLNKNYDQTIIGPQLRDLLILARPELIPRVSWIDLCLRTGNDPGALVKASCVELVQNIIKVTEDPLNRNLPKVQLAAGNAAADLAFVAPDTAIPIILQQIATDLDPSQLENVGPTEAAIFRTPEGTAFVDVLANKGPAQSLQKTAKDYDTLKWEEDLRAQLAEKKGQTRKLTADEQAKLKAQLAKESTIRSEIAQIESRLRRGVGIVASLASGPPTDSDIWLRQSLQLLLQAISNGAGLLLGHAPADAYIKCSERISSRIGTLRPFIGIATLRAIGNSNLPEELQAEDLGDMVTRILYRLRFLGEQRSFDSASLMYIFPLLFLVLERGGISKTSVDEADEQIVLSLEFISMHTDACSDDRLPRQRLLALLISTMQRYTQHYKLVKDLLIDLCRSLAANITVEEISTLVKGTIVPQISVRSSVLQAIDAEIDLSDLTFLQEIWLACHDDVAENVEIAQTIWEDSGFTVRPESATEILPYLESSDKQLRRAAARSTAEIIRLHPTIFQTITASMEAIYKEKAKPREPERDEYGLVKKTNLTDLWEARDGIAHTYRELAPLYVESRVISTIEFMVQAGPLGDRNATVRDGMIEACTAIIASKGKTHVEKLMQLFEQALEGPDRGSADYDMVNEAVIILYGALARHLKAGDNRVPKVVQRLLDTLSTPSETVQYAVAECLPPLVQASSQETSAYVQQMMDKLLNSKKYAERRGAAYGLAGIVSGKGIIAFREYRLLVTLKGATENKKEANQRQGAFLAYELLSLVLGRVFEPYVIQLVPQLLVGFGDSSADVREACLDAAKVCFSTLSSFGVKQVLPTLLEGLDDQQWRSKKGACDSLGAMAYLDPEQLALSLPEIIPPLTQVLTDSHKEVRASANRSLQRFGEVISNPEIKSTVNVLLKALSDPTKHTDDALDALIKVSFVHYLDAPSLALVVRILERGLGDRSATKRKSSQIIGSLAHLTERKDLTAHLPILVAGLKTAIVDPVPTTRATASKALGSLIEKLGEDALPDLIPSLMATLKSDTGAGDRLGSAQALSEVLAGLGTARLEETLPSILQNVQSSKSSVREGFMSLFIFLPACFGNSFANYLSKIIPSILGGLADDNETIRETALRAGRLLVKNFSSKAIDLLLPELERGLADDSHRIRLSSVELVGDLLFNLTGITGSTEEEEAEEGAKEAGQSLLEVLGEDKRNKVLSALYICRCDTSGLVRSAAINVWKALVATPRILRELIPTLTQLLIRRLASSNMEQKVIAGNALGELIRKAGEGVLASLLPTLEEGLHTTDSDAKQGICIALKELISAASTEVLEEYEKTLISVVRTALVDSDSEVREAAAEAFDSLQRILGKKAVDQVLPYLLNLLRNEDDAQNALSALLTLLTDNMRSNIILPTLLPTLLTTPMTAFNARAIASLAEVAGHTMTRRLPNIINALIENIVSTKDEDLRRELSSAFDTVLLSVDEYDGLNTAMSVMLGLVKHDDHRRRATADLHLSAFFARTDIDIARYHESLISALLVSFDDSDKDVVKAAWAALSELTKRLRKEEMDSLVISTRQVLNHVGVKGSNLPGFSLPKGINAILPIFLQGLMNGTATQREQAALAISDIVDRTNGDALRPFVTQITGPLIRVVSERSVEVKAAILFTLNNLLEKIPTLLKPFLPQLQRTFAKSLADTSSDVLRTRAAKALGTLITLTPRIDPLIAELVTGAKTIDTGVRNAMFKALFEVVSKAGSNMNEASRNLILGLIDADECDNDEATAITNARLFGALVKVVQGDAVEKLLKSRVLTTQFTRSSVFDLNAVLLDAAVRLTRDFEEETVTVISSGIQHKQPEIVDNCVLAAGKYLLTESSNKNFDAVKPLFEALAPIIQPGNPVDTRRLALVVIRTVARENSDVVRPHLPLLAPPIFASVRDPVIPIKLSAEAAFLEIFSVVEEETVVFDKYMAGPGSSLAPNQKRSMQDYFKRVATRLGTQARERKEAEGGHGGLGLSSDEKEDEREVWSVGKVDLGESALRDD